MTFTMWLPWIPERTASKFEATNKTYANMASKLKSQIFLENAMKNVLQDVKDENEETKKRIEEMQSELDNLTSIKTMLEQRIRELEDGRKPQTKRGDGKEKVKSSADIMREMKQKVQDLKSELKEVTTQKSSRWQLMKEMEASISNLQGEKISIGQEIEKLREEHKAMAKSHETGREEESSDRPRTEAFSTRRTVSSTDAQTQTLRQVSFGQDVESAGLLRDHDSGGKEAVSKISPVGTSSDYNLCSVSKITKQKAQIRRMKARNAALKEKLDKLRREFNSRSAAAGWPVKIEKSTDCK